MNYYILFLTVYIKENDTMKTIQRTLGIFIILFMLISPVQAKENTSSNWMEKISDETKLSAMSIPGTHDSATQSISLSPIFQCQDTDIQTQLENGYRYFDMRFVLDQDQLILKHNFAKCRKDRSIFSTPLTLNDVLEDIYTFLDKHPSETVIFCVKKENSKDDLTKVKSILNSKINTDSWYIENRIPILDEVRGKIILATRFKNEYGLYLNWEEQGDRTILDVPHKKEDINVSESLFVQDRFNYGVEDKIDAIEYSLENTKADDSTFHLNFTSTSGKGKIGFPKKYAKKINNHLIEYDWLKKNYGILIVDFADQELAHKIYSTN